MLGKTGALNARLLKWICSGLSSIYTAAASVRQYLPHLVDLIWNRKINTGKVFDLTLPLEQVAEGYPAVDERRAIKVLLRPWGRENTVEIHNKKLVARMREHSDDEQNYSKIVSVLIPL